MLINTYVIKYTIVGCEKVNNYSNQEVATDIIVIF